MRLCKESSCKIDTMAQYSFMLLVLAQTTALKVFGTPGRGPAIQRVYPADNSVKVEYWLGAGQLTSCTVDDVRGLQKCVKVVSAAVYTDEEDFETGRFGAAAVSKQAATSSRLAASPRTRNGTQTSAPQHASAAAPKRPVSKSSSSV